MPIFEAGRLGTTYTMTTSGTQTITATSLGAQIRKARVVADTAVYYAVGDTVATPTALSNAGAYLPANTIENIDIPPNALFAVITKATSGLVTSTHGKFHVTGLD